MYLYISPSGTKSWRYKYRFEGKERRLTFGLFPGVGLDDAREKRNVAWAALRAGNDPASIAKAAQDAVMFETVARAWITDQAPIWSQANGFRVRSRFEKDVFPAIGRRSVGEIDGPTVLRVLRKIEGRGSVETAKRVKGYVLAVLKRAHAEGFVRAENILSVGCIGAALKPTIPGIKLPALTRLDDLIELQGAVDRSTASIMVKLASRLLALTVPRIGVLRTAPWTEFEGIDWEDPERPAPDAVWRIPAHRMKLEVEDRANRDFGHDIPLSIQAVEVLRALRILTGKFELAFINIRSWREPMSDAALSSLYKRMGNGAYKHRMVPHGWRSAFSTILNERAAELDRPGDRLLIDMALAHVPPGISASEWAYNRARYFRPRAILYQVWADLITTGLPSPVTLLKTRAG